MIESFGNSFQFEWKIYYDVWKIDHKIIEFKSVKKVKDNIYIKEVICKDQAFLEKYFMFT